MKLDEIIEQYQKAKAKVETTVQAVNAAKTKLRGHEDGLRIAARELDECEGFAKAARTALAVVARRVGPVLHAEVSGICGSDASLAAPDDAG